jgi:hypothetical protein
MTPGWKFQINPVGMYLLSLDLSHSQRQGKHQNIGLSRYLWNTQAFCKDWVWLEKPFLCRKLLSEVTFPVSTFRSYRFGSDASKIKVDMSLALKTNKRH